MTAKGQGRPGERSEEHGAERSTSASAGWHFAAWCVSVGSVLVQLALSLARLRGSWDDAAITAAFSRTWAQTGRIALTPSSPIVEGYSSVTWFLLLAVPAFFSRNPTLVLVWMKVLSALCALGSLGMVYRVALREFRSEMGALTSVLLVALCLPTQREITTGMEMNLAALLLLVLFDLLRRTPMPGRWWLAFLTGCLLLMTRFESPFALAFLLGGLIWAAWRAGDRNQLRRLLLLAGGLVLFFALAAVWRHHTFAEWMPNTIYAKRFLPYRDWTTVRRALKTRVLAEGELLTILAVPLLVTAFVAYCACFREGPRREQSGLEGAHISAGLWAVAASAVLFGLVFGQNWGYPGRMIAGMVPFLVLALVGVCLWALPARRELGAVLLLLVALQAVNWAAFTLFPITPVPIARIQGIGEGADRIRRLLGQERLVILLPDVGGSSLCCERLTILDAGLLADPTLARTGWQGFDGYFRANRPDVVSTQTVFAEASSIYGHHLLDDYGLVGARGYRFFVRGDLYRRLRDGNPEAERAVAGQAACLGYGDERDVAFSRSYARCLVF